MKKNIIYYYTVQESYMPDPKVTVCLSLRGSVELFLSSNWLCLWSTGEVMLGRLEVIAT